MRARILSVAEDALVLELHDLGVYRIALTLHPKLWQDIIHLPTHPVKLDEYLLI